MTRWTAADHQRRLHLRQTITALMAQLADARREAAPLEIRYFLAQSTTPAPNLARRKRRRERHVQRHRQGPTSRPLRLPKTADVWGIYG